MSYLAARRAARRAARASRPTALTLLLGHYITGRIAEAEWNRISACLDAAEADPTERDALAAFCLDVSARGEEFSPPSPDEIHDLLAAARA